MDDHEILARLTALELRLARLERSQPSPQGNLPKEVMDCLRRIEANLQGKSVRDPVAPSLGSPMAVPVPPSSFVPSPANYRLVMEWDDIPEDEPDEVLWDFMEPGQP